MKTTSKNIFGKLLAKTMVWVRPLVTKQPMEFEFPDNK